MFSLMFVCSQEGGVIPWATKTPLYPLPPEWVTLPAGWSYNPPPDKWRPPDRVNLSPGGDLWGRGRGRYCLLMLIGGCFVVVVVDDDDDDDNDDDDAGVPSLSPGISRWIISCTSTTLWVGRVSIVVRLCGGIHPGNIITRGTRGRRRRAGEIMSPSFF